MKEFQMIEDHTLLKTIFDAIPFVTLVVDDDVKILYWNNAASVLLGTGKDLIYRRRGGDAFHCLHAQENEKGCGHGSHCGDCVIRNSVGEAIGGKKINRKKTFFEISRDGRRDTIPLLVTGAPLVINERHLCLLILEDITELVQLRSILPICAKCKKIRNDANYWENVEGYIKTHIIDVDFSHGFCPACARELYPEIFKGDDRSD